MMGQWVCSCGKIWPVFAPITIDQAIEYINEGFDHWSLGHTVVKIDNVVCPMCNGTGNLSIGTGDSTGGTTDAAITPCPWCSGMGVQE